MIRINVKKGEPVFCDNANFYNGICQCFIGKEFIKGILITDIENMEEE